MSNTLVQRPTLAPDPAPREIINVDEYVVPDRGTRGPVMRSNETRTGSTPREAILIEDSDDEVQIIQRPEDITRPRFYEGPIVNPTHPRRRMLFSPSPPPRDNRVPPVPPIPHNIRERRPFIFHPFPDITDVVRPLEHPLSFEDILHAPPPLNEAPPREQNVNRRPNIGLGGALVSINRWNPEPPAYRYSGPPPANTRETNAMNGIWQNLGELGYGLIRGIVNIWEGGGEAPQLAGAEDMNLRNNRGINSTKDRRQSSLPEYLPSYTHPDKVDPGFSFHFEPQESLSNSDEPGPSTAVSDQSTVIVCSNCLDPLVMNATGSEEALRGCKLWALRCGHLLDGKCIEKIMKPSPVILPDIIDKLLVDQSQMSRLEGRNHEGQHLKNEATLSYKGKGKQKMRNESHVVLGTPSIDEPPPYNNFSRRKRRKLSGRDERYDEELGSFGSPEASIRSRLRPRRPFSVHESSSSQGIYQNDGLEPQAVFSGGLPVMPTEGILSNTVSRVDRPRTLREARLPRQKGGGRKRLRGKGKGKASAPVIEETFEWVCPVMKCSRIHMSVRIAGEWRMDEAQGAIAVYL